MISILAMSTVDIGSRSGRVKPRTMKLVFVASTLNKQHLGVRAKTAWLEIRITCSSGVT